MCTHRIYGGLVNMLCRVCLPRFWPFSRNSFTLEHTRFHRETVFTICAGAHRTRRLRTCSRAERLNASAARRISALELLHH